MGADPSVRSGFSGSYAGSVTCVDGRRPGQPWTDADADDVHRVCLVMADLGTPSPVGERDFAHRIAADQQIVGLGRAMAAGSFVPSGALPSWLPRHVTELGALVLAAPGRFDGRTICHGDLRPDNLLVRTDGTATVLDWNWVGVAAPWLDWVGLLPLMAAQGIDTDRRLARSPLTRDTDPEAVDAFVACIAAWMVTQFTSC